MQVVKGLSHVRGGPSDDVGPTRARVFLTRVSARPPSFTTSVCTSDLLHACGGASFRGWARLTAHGNRPRACGGLSSTIGASSTCPPSSPRAWGSVRLLPLRLPAMRVFPTHVGVCPSPTPSPPAPCSLPHVCEESPDGDDLDFGRPAFPMQVEVWRPFPGRHRSSWDSPHTGASLRPGMPTMCSRLPYTCGGRSFSYMRRALIRSPSPHAWGPIRAVRHGVRVLPNFPTCVEVCGVSSRSDARSKTLPVTRGLSRGVAHVVRLLPVAPERQSASERTSTRALPQQDTRHLSL